MTWDALVQQSSLVISHAVSLSQRRLSTKTGSYNNKQAPADDVIFTLSLTSRAQLIGDVVIFTVCWRKRGD